MTPRVPFGLAPSLHPAVHAQPQPHPRSVAVPGCPPRPRPTSARATLLPAAPTSVLPSASPPPPNPLPQEPGNSLLPNRLVHEKLLGFLAQPWTHFVSFLPKDLFIFKVSLHILIV